MISFFNALCFLWVAKTPPEKKIDKSMGFRTKKSMASQANWDKAQLEMIHFAQKAILPACVLGILFSVVEVYYLIHWSENIFTAILLLELLVTVIFYLKMYFDVSKTLEN